MKKNYFFVLLLILTNTLSVLAQKGNAGNPNFGVGLRIGDPTALSVKKYMNGRALELNIGRSYMFHGGSGYYNRRFDKWYNDWYQDYPHYEDFQYLGYSRTFPVSIQLHYLFQKDLNLSGVDNLQWYWGLGAQLRFQRYSFSYRYKLDGNPSWFYSDERVTDLDLGVDGIIGLEYTMQEIPLSFFADFNLFIEFADNPFAFWPQGGIGIRYNF